MSPSVNAMLRADEPTSWAEATDGLTLSDGFLPYYADAKGGRILASFPKPDEDGLSLYLLFEEKVESGTPGFCAFCIPNLTLASATKSDLGTDGARTQ